LHVNSAIIATYLFLFSCICAHAIKDVLIDHRRGPGKGAGSTALSQHGGAMPTSSPNQTRAPSSSPRRPSYPRVDPAQFCCRPRVRVALMSPSTFSSWFSCRPPFSPRAKLQIQRERGKVSDTAWFEMLDDEASIGALSAGGSHRSRRYRGTGTLLRPDFYSFYCFEYSIWLTWSTFPGANPEENEMSDIMARPAG